MKVQITAQFNQDTNTIDIRIDGQLYAYIRTTEPDGLYVQGPRNTAVMQLPRAAMKKAINLAMQEWLVLNDSKLNRVFSDGA